MGMHFDGIHILSVFPSILELTGVRELPRGWFDLKVPKHLLSMPETQKTEAAACGEFTSRAITSVEFTPGTLVSHQMIGSTNKCQLYGSVQSDSTYGPTVRSENDNNNDIVS